MTKKLSVYLSFFFLFAGSIMASEPAKGDTVTYRIDTTLSRLYWSCNIHHGYMYLKQGCIKTVGDQVVAADILFQMDSVFDQDITYELMRKTLQNILRSDVFFNTKEYPYSRFSLEESCFLKKNDYQFSGDLEMMGIPVCITFRAAISRKGKILRAKSQKFYVNRLDWGITSYSQHVAVSEENFIVSDSIGVSFDLRAINLSSE